MNQEDFKKRQDTLTKIDEDIATLDEYSRALLKLQSSGPSVIKKKVTTEYFRPCLGGEGSPEVTKVTKVDDEYITILRESPRLRERVRELHKKVIVLYYTYEPILNLPYKVGELSWIYLSPGIRGKYSHNPLGPVRDFHGRLVGLKERQGEKKASETPAYQWEIKGQEVSCNGSRPIKLEDRMSKIFKYLHDRRGKPVKIQSLEKEVGLTREGIRDAMIDLKNLLSRELGIDRNQMDKIIEAVKDRENKNEITAYVFY